MSVPFHHLTFTFRGSQLCYIIGSIIFCLDKSFVSTSILLSRQKLYLWQLPPMILLKVSSHQTRCDGDDSKLQLKDARDSSLVVIGRCLAVIGRRLAVIGRRLAAFRQYLIVIGWRLAVTGQRSAVIEQSLAVTGWWLAVIGRCLSFYWVTVSCYQAVFILLLGDT